MSKNLMIAMYPESEKEDLEMTSYKKFTWVGNQISDEDMRKLYQIKKSLNIPITKLVAVAVKEFIKRIETEVSNENNE